tara:strand:+ start:457 stop:810 length:354 start_codon:yes stop_codon:yes gene_type:complete
MVKKLLIISLLVVILDQITKFIFSGNINTGAAFSLFQGYNSILIIISILVILAILYYRKNHPIALGLLLGGTLSNLIDRIIYGGVLDFIYLIYWNTNIADLANILGAILLIIHFRKK